MHKENHFIQTVNPRRTTIRGQIRAYASSGLLAVFGAVVLVSYGYVLAVSLRSDDLLIMHLVVTTVTTTVPLVVGWLIAKKHPQHTIALLFLIMAYTSAIGNVAVALRLFSETLSGPIAGTLNSLALIVGHIMWAPGVYFPLFLLPLYFPTGKLLSPRWRALVVLILSNIAWGAIGVIFRPWPWNAYGILDTRMLNGIPGTEQFFDTTLAIFNTLFVPALPLVIIATALRYRRSRGVERLQMKWALFAVLFFALLAPILIAFPGIVTWDGQNGFPLTWTMAMLFPVSIGIAILRHRLFDIDVVISRTLVYGSLTALIVTVYVAVVSGLGLVFQAKNNTFVGLVAAGFIAVLFQPARARLQRYANRLVYGDRDDPAAVLTQLAHQTETAGTPGDILPNLARTIARTLKIPHVAIWLPVAASQMELVASWGEAPERTQAIPLTYQNEAIGHLVVAPRGPREQFNRREQNLLETIAALTATTVRAVQLSDEVRRSRRRIVSAREEERRRLRRDLHDGLGPQLASQTLGLEAVAQFIPGNPEKAQALLDSLKTQSQEAMEDVRHLVYDLRPPPLDNFGLVEALRRSASRYESATLRIVFDIPEAPFRDLPAAVETAAYRIAQEAMTNVVRHAKATHCVVKLACSGTQLTVEVRDNGRGLPTSFRSGVGLLAMRERAAELNGQYKIESLPEGGTLLQTTLPLETSDG